MEKHKSIELSSLLFQFFDQLLRCYSNRDAVEQFQETCADTESPEQVYYPKSTAFFFFLAFLEGWSEK